MSVLLDNLNAQIAVEIEFDKKSKEVREYKINKEWEKLQRIKKKEENLSSCTLDDVDFDKRKLSMKLKHESMRNSVQLLTEDFSNIVSFSRGELITFLAPSGEGKSTLSSNLVYNCLKSSKNGKTKRVVVLSNEEDANDTVEGVYARFNNLDYVNRKNWSDETLDKISKFMVDAHRKKFMRIINDDHFGEEGGATTSVEGIIKILTMLEKDSVQTDLVIIDYFQGVTESNADLKSQEWEAQAKLINWLDQFKNRFNGCLVVLGQIQSPDNENFFHIDSRFQGSKKLKNKSTAIIEMATETETSTTFWYVHKNRFGKKGDSFRTVFHRGEICSFSDTRKDVRDKVEFYQIFDSDRTEQEKQSPLKKQQAKSKK